MGWAVHAETRTALDHEILSTGISWTSEDLRRRYGRGVGGLVSLEFEREMPVFLASPTIRLNLLPP